MLLIGHLNSIVSIQLNKRGWRDGGWSSGLLSLLDGSRRRESVFEDPPWSFGKREMKKKKSRKNSPHYNLDEGLSF